VSPCWDLLDPLSCSWEYVITPSPCPRCCLACTYGFFEIPAQTVSESYGEWGENIDFDIFVIIGPLLLTYGLMYFFPMFAQLLVKEKESHKREGLLTQARFVAGRSSIHPA
jgi:hypothetical protein